MLLIILQRTGQAHRARAGPEAGSAAAERLAVLISLCHVQSSSRAERPRSF